MYAVSSYLEVSEALFESLHNMLTKFRWGAWQLG
jgi:hypothetical protein